MKKTKPPKPKAHTAEKGKDKPQATPTQMVPPQIGFDRLIRLEWIRAALEVRTGQRSVDQVEEMLSNAGLGKEAMAKTRTKLNGLCLQPRPELADFVARGSNLLTAVPPVPVVAIAWGMAITVYPFFAKVAELAGRLTAIQGDCSTLEIHRRISEFYGERQVTKRATQAVLQTQADWGAVERMEKGKRIARRTPRTVTNEQAVAWLIEGLIRAIGRPIPAAALQSHPVLFPFLLDPSIAYVVSKNPSLEMRTEGGGGPVVAVRAVA